MKFGLRLIQYLGEPRELVELAALGEQAGFDSVWFPHDTFMHNTWALTSAVAMATSRIEIGGVGISPFHSNPCEIATYLATLDSLSNGRARLGLGFHTEEFVHWTGLDTSGYLARTREACEIIRALFRGEVVDYQGEAYHWNEQCYFRLTPCRDQVPIYICPFGEDYLQLSGAIGDGSLPMITPPASASYMTRAIHAGAQRAARACTDVDISGCAWLSISASHDAAAEKLKHMVAYFGPHLEEPALNTIGLSRNDMLPMKKLIDQQRYADAYSLVSDDMLKLGIVGTPNQVIEAIAELEDAGITEVNLGGPLGPDPREAIRLLGEQVIPCFQ